MNCPRISRYTAPASEKRINDPIGHIYKCVHCLAKIYFLIYFRIFRFFFLWKLYALGMGEVSTHTIGEFFALLSPYWSKLWSWFLFQERRTFFQNFILRAYFIPSFDYKKFQWHCWKSLFKFARGKKYIRVPYFRRWKNFLRKFFPIFGQKIDYSKNFSYFFKFFKNKGGTLFIFSSTATRRGGYSLPGYGPEKKHIRFVISDFENN